ncbi:unnamed protein product [Calypogeia fissa]
MGNFRMWTLTLHQMPSPVHQPHSIPPVDSHPKNEMEEDPTEDSDDELDHLGDESPNVDPPDPNAANSEPEPEAVSIALDRVDALIERIRARPPTTPLNAAIQTPSKFVQPDERTPVIMKSDGERSKYEEHFNQSLAKDDKACKLATRTPEADGPTGKKLGKKKHKQLQFLHLRPPRLVLILATKLLLPPAVFSGRMIR